jgi:CBS domain-containing protein
MMNYVNEAKTTTQGGEKGMGDEKKIKDIMVPIEEYHTIDQDAELRVAMKIVKKDYEDLKASRIAGFHKTLFVTGANGKIVGKLSMHDFFQGLIPEHAKAPELSRAYYSVLSSRAIEVEEEIRDFQQRFEWLHHGFLELVKQAAGKKVREVMSPVHPVLKEEDSINHAIYAMFKEKVRRPLVIRDGQIVGVVDSIHIFNEFIELVGFE